MDEQPRFRSYLIQSLFLGLIGWGGLALLLNFALPIVPARLAFFILWVMALTGTALPLTYFFNHRFPSDPPADANVIVRQALWVGVYGAILAWLQLGRLVSLWVWMGLGGAFIAAEYLIRLRERARWKPPVPSDDNAT
jgi:hypothetical protein